MRMRERVRDRNGDLKTHIMEIARNTETNEEIQKDRDTERVKDRERLRGRQTAK